MKLSSRIIERLAKMVVGDAQYFPYRSSGHITKFFKRCELPFVHDGSTRARWAEERLAELSLGISQSPDLPPDNLCRVIVELFDSDDYGDHNEARADRDGRVSMEDCASLENALMAFNHLVKINSTAYPVRHIRILSL